MQCLLNIVYNFRRRFNANGQANRVFQHAESQPFFGRQLKLRGPKGMQIQRFVDPRLTACVMTLRLEINRLACAWFAPAVDPIMPLYPESSLRWQEYVAPVLYPTPDDMKNTKSACAPSSKRIPELQAYVRVVSHHFYARKSARVPKADSSHFLKIKPRNAPRYHRDLLRCAL